MQVEDLKIQKCYTCEKEIRFHEMMQNKEDCSDLVVLNFHDKYQKNYAYLFCCSDCYTDLKVLELPQPYCVMCDSICTDPKWNVSVRFAQLGNWLSYKTVCSQQCRKILVYEARNDESLEFKYQCMYCGKSSDTKIPHCSICKVVYYCDKICQQRDWVNHKQTCTK